MAPADHPADRAVLSLPRLDHESADWLRALTGTGAVREAALGRLHKTLLQIARSEIRRRRDRLDLAGPELDDLAYQAAADALLAITGKLGQYRGESRFTTWAYKFVIFEVSAKAARPARPGRPVPMAAEDWDRLPDRFELEPAQVSQWRDLTAAVRRAVDSELTSRQRQVFVALVLGGTPPDAVAAELGVTRGAIYKAMYDARRKLRAALAAGGYLGHDEGSRS